MRTTAYSFSDELKNPRDRTCGIEIKKTVDDWQCDLVGDRHNVDHFVRITSSVDDISQNT
jgi:hypothetical protein